MLLMGGTSLQNPTQIGLAIHMIIGVLLKIVPSSEKFQLCGSGRLKGSYWQIQ